MVILLLSNKYKSRKRVISARTYMTLFRIIYYKNNYKSVYVLKSSQNELL